MKGIEGGGPGGIGAAVGPRISGFVSEGPAQGFGSLASLGHELKTPPIFTNDRPGGLENTMSYTIAFNNSGNYAIEPLRQPSISPAPKFDILSEVNQIANKAWNKPFVESGAAVEHSILPVQPPAIKVPEVFQRGLANVNLNPADRALETVSQPLVTIENVAKRESRKAQSLLMLVAGQVAARVFFPIPLENAAIVTPKSEVNQAIIAEAEPKVGVQASTYIRSQTHPATAESSRHEEEEIEQRVEEEELVEEPVESLEDEGVKKIRLKRVVDDRALSQIIVEIKQGVKKAKAIANMLGTKITGSLLAKFLPGQHPGNESEDVKGKGLDGSISERKEAIEAHGEFASEFEAEERSVKVAYEKPPIKVREHGKTVSTEDVYRVHKNNGVRPGSTEMVLEIIKRRHLKKGIPQIIPVINTEVEQAERRIEDAPGLAEVFQKAA